MVLCEYALEVAQGEAEREMKSVLLERMCKLADEIIATAEEDEPEIPQDC
jgi:hypothetical protein